jgi:hypothetical protein
MEYLCPVCNKPYDGVFCTACTTSSGEKDDGKNKSAEKQDTAYLVDLVTNRKIPIATPLCKCGRDESNNIVISGDQSISRNHFTITREGNQYYVKDENSRHGTFLNGKQLFTTEPVSDGDVLKVGVSLFWFVLEPADQADKALTAQAPSSAGSFDANGGQNDQEKADAITSIRPGKGAANLSDDQISTVTSDNIPVRVTDETLSAKYRFKTHSFDSSNKQGNSLSAQAKGSKPSFNEPANTPRPADKTDLPNKPGVAGLSSRSSQSETGEFTQLDPAEYLSQVQEPVGRALSANDLIESLDLTPDKTEKRAAEDSGEVKSDSGEAESGETGAETAKATPGFMERLSATLGTNKEPNPPKGEGKALLGSLLSSLSGDKPKQAGGQDDQNSTLAVRPKTPPQDYASDRLKKQIERLDNADNGKVKALEESAAKVTSQFKHLDEQLTNLTDQFRFLQQKFEDLSEQISQTRKARNTLLAIQSINGEDLSGCCVKVFAQTGFSVSIIESESGKSNQELKLQLGEITAIVRIVGPLGERADLGQLAMDLAHFWLEGKTEPKGILVVASTGESDLATPNTHDNNDELADYAIKKNVCLITTDQLIAMYSSLMSNDSQALVVQNQILETRGWLEGFGQAVATNSGDKSSKLDQLSFSLSA